jgi:NAD-dependent aldehyde dehydrogenases
VISSPDKKILQAAAKSVKRTHLELGGKAPVIVCDDADLDEVVNGIRTYGYYNAGQDCTAACRIYAQAGIYPKLVDALGEAVASLRFARKRDQDNEIGPLISSRQRDRVASFVERALSQPHIELITGAAAHSGPGFLLPADPAGGMPAKRRNRAARGVWPGGQHHAL